MKDLVLNGVILSIAEASAFEHPGLRPMQFVFCDDKPNANGMGVEYQDFAQLAMTSIGMPVKMKYTGSWQHEKAANHKTPELGYKVEDHQGSIPIGYIKSMSEKELEDGTHQLIADALLFDAEYPEEINYLRESFAEGTAPGLSWEILHDEKKSILRDGVLWLKGLITKAATFVREPAYGNRTAILALASNQTLTEAQVLAEISAIVTDTSPKNIPEGGNNRMEEEIKDLKEQIAALNTTVSEKVAEIERLSTENSTLTTSVSELSTKVETFEGEKKLASRTAELVEAGITIEIKPERISKMDDEAFAEYVADLKATAEKVKTEVEAALKAAPSGSLALASRRPAAPAMPKFGGSDDSGSGEPSLKEKFGRISRTAAVTE